MKKLFFSRGFLSLSLVFLVSSKVINKENSVKFIKPLNRIISNTNHIPKVTPAPAKNIKIIFAGDFMFDRYIRQMAQKHGNDFILENVKDVLVESDLTIVNLEGPITKFSSISMYSEFGSRENYIFTFDPSIVKTLKDHNIKLVNIGNNHILNFGKEGLDQTKSFLKTEEINYFGNTGNEEDQTFYIYEKEETKIAFINYNQFVKNGKEITLENIALLKERADILIIYAHWGIEYKIQANKSVQSLAHEFIDQGADLIIGSHPHVIQQTEIYKKKTIYYSLGNFVFDQYFSDQTKKGMLLEVSINPENYQMAYKEIPILTNQNGQTQLEKQN